MPLAPTLSVPTITPAGGRPSRADPRLPAIPDETVVVRRAARAAEDDGDLLGARRLVALLPADAERWRWRDDLETGLRLGADHPVAAADPGAAAAWWSGPAMRFGLESPRAARLLMLATAVLQARGVPAPQRHRMAPGCLFDEPALLDAGLCDLGVLPLYLERLVGQIRDELDSLSEWHRYPATVWDVEGHVPGGLLVRDPDGLRRVVATPLLQSDAAAAAVGTLLYGRIVPLPRPGSAPWGFAVPPVPVDRLCARRVLRAVVRRGPVAERLRAITPMPAPAGPRSRPMAARSTA